MLGRPYINGLPISERIFRLELSMTIDKSLKVRRGATRNRSVLTRVERIARLVEADKWTDGDSPLGLPKVRVRKLTMKKKKKKKEEEAPREPKVEPLLLRLPLLAPRLLRQRRRPRKHRLAAPGWREK